MPYHCITNASKFRVVFNCSARFGRTSLYDQLMHGPDLTNTLIGILLRFRKFPIALVGDIKSMFLQVLVDKNNRDALRLLWFKDGNLEQQPIEYRMRSHTFWAKSLPCCAASTLRRTARDNLTDASQRVAKVVVKNMYADNLCLSCPSEQEAVDLLEQISSL